MRVLATLAAREGPAMTRNIENTITVHVQDKCLAGGSSTDLRVVRGATGLDDLGSKPLTPRRGKVSASSTDV